MEEAEQFHWLAAMDDGHVIATGSPAEVRARAGADTLEEAFIAMLPEEKRKVHKALQIPPRVSQPGPPSIEAEGLTKRFGSFTAVDHVSFRIEKGEIFGFLGSNGCGKSTTMKMLTGLLPATEGKATLLGQPVDGQSIETRQRIGYMSQAFSLYGELTVRQNLELHAKLFDLPAPEQGPRVQEMLDRFGLKDVADSFPESLPLGVRQRLQLAVAVQHRPEVLILDEPTSGVDPVARDQFWEFLIDLSRKDGVTIFLSTHFMNEADRCDRISLMNAGKVLAADTPKALRESRKAKTLEEAFIGYLEDAARAPDQSQDKRETTTESEPKVKEFAAAETTTEKFSVHRIWAVARREAVEIMRDPVRIAFALLSPMLLMFAFGYGISFDVEHLRFAVFDQSRSIESREFLESFEGSRFWSRQPDIAAPDQIQTRLRSGELKFAIEIPPLFGSDLLRERRPEIAIWINGDMPNRAETTRTYLGGLTLDYLAKQSVRHVRDTPNLPSTATGDPSALPVNIETRFRYNQSLKSVYSMVPSVIMMMLILIPAIMTALGVVREVETGSIANFRSTPLTSLEFLLGKQVPYLVIGLISFATLIVLALFVFAVPVTGSWLALVIGAVIYLGAATAFGLVVSTVTRTQVAAVFATAILALIPVSQFSGLLVPVSSLSGAGRAIGLAFPASWFQQISMGTFNKALGFSELWFNHLVLAAFVLAFITAASLILRKQES
jgi:ribosome-dependent ATPase